MRYLFRSYLCIALLAVFVPVWAQDTLGAQTPTPAPRSAATLTPDISVIGNILGVASDRAAAEDDAIQLEELELVLGSGIYPGIRGDVVIALHQPEFTAEVEEGFLTCAQLTPRLPVGARAGIVRLPFGKVNPLHPHQLPTVNAPVVVTNLLGEEFIGNGCELNALLPAGSHLFLQAHLGRWNPRAHHHHEEEEGEGEEHEHELGAGFDESFTLGRLWTGTSLRDGSEVELGASGAWGKGARHDGETVRPDVSLYGVDVTWRKWLRHERRLMLQGEWIRRRAEDADARATQSGYYLLGTYRPSNLYEFGARYDWSKAPEQEGTHENYLSAFATRALNETTYARVQVTHGRDLTRAHVTELWVQLVFGFGPHAHALQ